MANTREVGTHAFEQADGAEEVERPGASDEIVHQRI
jgi:hypothetical protein